ncbi:MAG: FAD:protein transferase [Patescibacteria group bacterium]|nr:FAD:protein FMN transferase [Candidatus Saccharibacteria bacterium]MDQ5963173.1 FAD:protein transferase [Patescibacteria group bacterium]
MTKSTDDSNQSPLVSHTFSALGTVWNIELEDGPAILSVQAAIARRVRDFELAYSRFDPNSLISQLNETGRLVNPPKELLAMLEFAADMYAKSNGIFNISVGATLQNTGYGIPNEKKEVTANLWKNITFNQNKIKIPKNVALDFGGFGKGWLIDALAALLDRSGLKNYVINGGGDLFAKLTEPQEFGLEHPLVDTAVIGTTRISRGALAVSSTVKRQWKQGDTTHHHIIDPRQQASSDSEILSVYARADSALIADTCATILLIDPAQNARLKKLFGLQTILLKKEQF